LCPATENFALTAHRVNLDRVNEASAGAGCLASAYDQGQSFSPN
jgi:hypothetical protein